MPMLETAFILALLWLVTSMAYAADKHFAQGNRWRIPETNVHLPELPGGWPGSLLARRMLRHKIRKTGHRIVFRMMVALNVPAMDVGAFWGR